MRGHVLSRRVAPYLFLAPFIVIYGVFWAGPILSSFYYSLTDWTVAGTSKFVGFANYARLLTDPRFHTALWNTLLFWVVYTVIMVGLALASSIVLHHSNIRGKVLFRSALFIPVTVSMAVVAIIFEMVFARGTGLLNLVLGQLGVPRVDWLGDPRVALWSIVIVKVWRAFGYYGVILLAGLQAIPSDVYEAARVDGASWFQTVFRITLPLLRPVLAFVVVMSTIWALELFDEPWILTGGGPYDSTLTVAIYLYQHSFQFMQLGYGSSVAFVLTLIIVLIALFERRLVDRDY